MSEKRKSVTAFVCSETINLKKNNDNCRPNMIDCPYGTGFRKSSNPNVSVIDTYIRQLHTFRPILMTRGIRDVSGEAKRSWGERKKG